jgi:hypothetical protein
VVRKVALVLAVALVFALVGYVFLGLGSPGPHEAPWIGWAALGLLALAILTLVGGLRWLPISVAGVAGAGVILYVGLQLRQPVERPLAYWPIDARTLGVLVGDAVNLSCDIARVDESSDAVRIHARCWERVLGVPGPGMLQPYLLEVTLQAPLGHRTVYDGSGNPGRSCENPDGCRIPG